MVEMGKHLSNDWCHLCGKRVNPLVDIWYMNNAEHPNPTEETHYIRICGLCVKTMAKILGDKPVYEIICSSFDSKTMEKNKDE